MTNAKPKKIHTNTQALASKKVRALEAARMQKKAVESNRRGRPRKVVTVTDENVNSTTLSKPSRRSSRLKGVTAGISGTGLNVNAEPLLEKVNLPPAKKKAAKGKGIGNNDLVFEGLGRVGRSANGASVVVAKPGRKGSAHAPTPIDEDVQSNDPGAFDEITDLKRLLEAERSESRQPPQ